MKHIIITLLFMLYVNVLSAQQLCNTEIEIPSTTPSSHFVDNGDGTISDLTTRLMWQRCQLGFSGESCEIVDSPIIFNWQEALQEAQANTLADYNEWRLPNVKELRGIIEQRCQSPAINSELFLETASSDFWTSSPYNFNANNSWAVNFNTGNNIANSRTSHLYVRLVRSE
jgi:hypothetical protein